MNKVIISIVLAVAIMLLFFGNLVWGSVSIPYREVVGALTGNQTVSDTYGYIILESRLPQAITALLSGAALATSGLLLQTAFRNPLAGPDVFGISSGAGLAVAIVMLAFGGNISLNNLCLGFLDGECGYAIGGFMAILVSAFAGAMLVMGIITAFSAIVRSHTVLLIIGLMVGYLASSAISLLNFFSTAEGVKSYLIWGMGSFGNVSMDEVRWFVPFAILALLASLLLIKPLNAMLLGERICGESRFSYQETSNCPARHNGYAYCSSYCLLWPDSLYRACHSSYITSAGWYGKSSTASASYNADGGGYCPSM